MVIFTLEDGEIVWTDKSSQTNGTNIFFDEQIVWYLVVWKDDCPSRRTSRRQCEINSHQMDKCQTICPSRRSRFVLPLVWKRPMLCRHVMSRDTQWAWVTCGRTVKGLYAVKKAETISGFPLKSFSNVQNLTCYPFQWFWQGFSLPFERFWFHGLTRT